MGSAGWRTLATHLGNGKISPSDLDLFSLTGPNGEKFYNQWAAIIYQSSRTVYGFAYSDYLQPGVALAATMYNLTPVSSWTITVQPESAGLWDRVGKPRLLANRAFGA
jgi:hypothetical protein